MTGAVAELGRDDTFGASLPIETRVVAGYDGLRYHHAARGGPRPGDHLPLAAPPRRCRAGDRFVRHRGLRACAVPVRDVRRSRRRWSRRRPSAPSSPASIRRRCWRSSSATWSYAVDNRRHPARDPGRLRPRQHGLGRVARSGVAVGSRRRSHGWVGSATTRSRAVRASSATTGTWPESPLPGNGPSGVADGVDVAARQRGLRQPRRQRRQLRDRGESRLDRRCSGHVARHHPRRPPRRPGDRLDRRRLPPLRLLHRTPCTPRGRRAGAVGAVVRPLPGRSGGQRPQPLLRAVTPDARRGARGRDRRWRSGRRRVGDHVHHRWRRRSDRLPDLPRAPSSTVTVAGGHRLPEVVDWSAYRYDLQLDRLRRRRSRRARRNHDDDGRGARHGRRGARARRPSCAPEQQPLRRWDRPGPRPAHRALSGPRHPRRSRRRGRPPGAERTSPWRPRRPRRLSRVEPPLPARQLAAAARRTGTRRCQYTRRAASWAVEDAEGAGGSTRRRSRRRAPGR